MTRVYNVVDAAGHIREPVDLWERYLDPEFLDPHARIGTVRLEALPYRNADMSKFYPDGDVSFP